MGMNSVKVLVIAALAVALSGCSLFPIGPDLAATPSPFGDAPVVRLLDPDSDDQPVEIQHTAAGDTTIIPVSPMSAGKSFNAGLTWHGFDGGLKDGKDYWLVGINLFRTPDRSAYALLRFPHGTAFAPHSESRDAEMLMMTCTMRNPELALGFDPSEDDEDDEDVAGANSKPCDFETLDEVYAFVPQVLAASVKEDQDNAGKAEDDQSHDYKWEPVRIVVP